MNEFFEACYCWVRQKKDISNNKEDNLSETLKNNSWCGGCFKFINNLSEFAKISKIGDKYYGFCCENCYENWLSEPTSQHIAPISPKLLATCSTHLRKVVFPSCDGEPIYGPIKR